MSLINSYARLADLAAYLVVDESTLTATDQRMLYRASELIYSITMGQHDYPYPAGSGDDLIDVTVDPYPALLLATCAQVEYWRVNGEDVDTAVPTQNVNVGRIKQQYAGVQAQRLAPRALDALDNAGLLYRGVQAW